MSVFSKNYWLSKGYSEEEASYQISIRRPNNVNYYINKGHSLEEAEMLVKQRQSKGGQARASLSDKEKRKLTPRCIEFWLSKGLSKEDAEKSLFEHQALFSKEKCIKKYGEKEGLLIWQERQVKWQETLNSKTDEEKIAINKKKNHWANKDPHDANKVKAKTSATLKKFYDEMSLEEKIELGKSISKRMIDSGFATPIEERDAFEEYRNKVNSVTKRFDLTKLDNFDKRGPLSYHIDHKYSVFEGFKNNISHEIIGHICNLEMLEYNKNTSKGEKCSITLEQLLEHIEKYNDPI